MLEKTARMAVPSAPYEGRAFTLNRKWARQHRSRFPGYDPAKVERRCRRAGSMKGLPSRMQAIIAPKQAGHVSYTEVEDRIAFP